MTKGISEQILIFRSQLANRRLGDEILNIMEAILVEKDVKSLIEIRSILKETLRCESIHILQEIKEKCIEHKLNTLEFLVRAFAFVGDVKSCLALKYEALLLREFSCMTHSWLEVSHEEWLKFAVDSSSNGFHSIAVRGYENALLCIQAQNTADRRTESIENINKLKSVSASIIASQSVQAETAEYLKKKAAKLQEERAHNLPKSRPHASSMFRTGINRRNLQKLHGIRRRGGLRSN